MATSKFIRVICLLFQTYSNCSTNMFFLDLRLSKTNSLKVNLSEPKGYHIILLYSHRENVQFSKCSYVYEPISTLFSQIWKELPVQITIAANSCVKARLLSSMPQRPAFMSSDFCFNTIFAFYVIFSTLPFLFLCLERS